MRWYWTGMNTSAERKRKWTSLDHKFAHYLTMVYYDKDHCPTYLWEDSNHRFLWLPNKGQKISDDKGHSLHMAWENWREYRPSWDRKVSDPKDNPMVSFPVLNATYVSICEAVFASSRWKNVTPQFFPRIRNRPRYLVSRRHEERQLVLSYGSQGARLLVG